jgi:Alkaline phosphatase PhoX
MDKRRIGVLVAVIVSVAATLVAGASAGDPGMKTSTASMLTATAPGATAEPIISVGDTLSNGYTFESIPDGIALLPNGKGTVDVFVNHETSLVPFPYTGNIATCTPSACVSDSDNSQVSRLRLHQGSAGVLSGEIALNGSKNYQRFCSNSMAGPEQGFRRSILFTNEEATDFVSPPPLSAWPADPTNQRQAGLVVGLDARNGKTYEIPGLGRMNHENTVVVPGGWNGIVALTGDDTFSAPSSQLYMYSAASDQAMLADKGTLWAFRVTSKNGVPVIPANAFNNANDYGDIALDDSFGGEFIEVPRNIAVGDQAPLEAWSNANNVFQFIRVEDIAYDPDNPRVVYFADTGEPRAISDPTTGRLSRGPSGTMGDYMNGRIFKIVLNAANPRTVDSLSIVVDADLGGYKNTAVIHQPDNVAVSSGSLMIQEDPGSHNGTSWLGAPNARVWRYDLAQESLTVVAEVDQSLTPSSPNGSWESSGIVDASAVFGPGTWLLDVQAHTLIVDSEVRTVTVGSASGPMTFKREGGQLLLLTVPGS